MAFTQEEEQGLRELLELKDGIKGIIAIEGTKVAAYSDDVALLAPGLYPKWDGNGHTYEEGERFTYNGEIYYPNQKVTTQAQHTPDITTGIYVKLSLGGDGIPIWNMDALASDPNIYNTGKKVHYPDANGPVYTSKRDGNTSVPGTDQWWALDE